MMRFKHTVIFFISIIIITNSCKENNEVIIELNPKYSSIKTISADADCIGPKGSYITKIKSFEDGSCTFYQEYSYRDVVSKINISSNKKGYSLSEKNVINDTLSIESIEIVKSHEFHKMHTKPLHFFKDLKYVLSADDKIDLYKGIDNLKNPVSIRYDKKNKTINSVIMRNPYDTTETIDLHFKKWIKSDYGKLVKELEIIQGKKDTFSFSYKEIKINNILIKI